MKHFCLNCGVELKEEQLLCPKCGHCSFLDSLETTGKSIAGVLTAQQIEINTQWVKYKCGKEGLTGHGFAAEDANAINEILWGNNVDLNGRDNSKYGPDRTTNGIKIQTKYCKTAKESVQASFDPETGMYAYKGQILEVPRDQYGEAIKIMGEKISSGKVDGVTDPNDAAKIVKKGTVTYRQAKNITKAGNIDSLIFDAQTQSITAVSAFGISFAINLGMLILSRDRNNFKVKEAIQMAFLSGLQNGTISMTSGILTSQVLRTQFGRNLTAYIQWGTKSGVDTIYKFKLGKDLVHKLSQTLFDKGIYGGAAKNAATKFLRTNIIANAAVLIVASLPDTYYLLQGKISAPQYIKNLVVNGASIGGATVGVVLGSMLGPHGMLAGGIIGGAAGEWASKSIADHIKVDDSEKMYQLIKVALIQLSHDYMIQSDEEFQKCINAISSDKAIDTNLIKVMYSIGRDDDNDFLRVQIAYEKLKYYFGAIIRQRKTIHLKDNQSKILEAIDKLGELIYIPDEGIALNINKDDIDESK